jgi:hypothetical protein
MHMKTIATVGALATAATAYQQNYDNSYDIVARRAIFDNALDRLARRAYYDNGIDRLARRGYYDDDSFLYARAPTKPGKQNTNKPSTQRTSSTSQTVGTILNHGTTAAGILETVANAKSTWDSSSQQQTVGRRFADPDFDDEYLDIYTRDAEADPELFASDEELLDLIARDPKGSIFSTIGRIFRGSKNVPDPSSVIPSSSSSSNPQPNGQSTTSKRNAEPEAFDEEGLDLDLFVRDLEDLYYF